VGVARNRPLRLTPHGKAGVVYKGRVHEVRGTTDNIYYIDAAAESWSEASTVCPFALNRDAQRLLQHIKQDCHRTSSGTTASIDAVAAPVQPPNKDASAGSRAGGSHAKDRTKEILELLLPHAKSIRLESR
jgi:hypothetical protein